MAGLLVYVGGARGLGKSKYAALVVPLIANARYLNLEQMLQYTAEHTLGKRVETLTLDELEQVGSRSFREVSNSDGLTLIDGSYARYADHEPEPKPYLPPSLVEKIGAFILVDCDVETAVWLRQRRNFPPNLMERGQVEKELEVERRMAREVAASAHKQLIVLKRERNVDFAQVLRKAVEAAP